MGLDVVRFPDPLYVSRGTRLDWMGLDWVWMVSSISWLVVLSQKLNRAKATKLSFVMRLPVAEDWYSSSYQARVYLKEFRC